MGFLISSREGRLCIDGKRINEPSVLISNTPNFDNGDLSIPAIRENLLACSQVILNEFIIPKGKLLDKGELDGTRNLDIVDKYDLPFESESLMLKPFRGFFRSDRNLTRGWCYYVAATLHRFFYKEFDLWKVRCPYVEEGKKDFHWWLQNKNGDVIDLAEEQYRIHKIYEPRVNGKKSSPMGWSYSVKTRNIAIKVAESISGNEIDQTVVKTRNYKKS